MAYVVNYKGVTISVNSLDEAAELANKLTVEANGEHRRIPRKQLPAKDEPTKHQNDDVPDVRIRGMIKFLAPRERNVLGVLVKQQQGLKTDELAKAAEIPASDIKYAMKRIHAFGRHRGINGKLFIDCVPDYSRRPVKSTYKMCDRFREVLASMFPYPPPETNKQ